MLAGVESPVGFGSANLTTEHYGRIFYGTSKTEVIIRKAPVPTHLAQHCLVFNCSITHKPSKRSFPLFSYSSETVFPKGPAPYKSCMKTYRKQSATGHVCAPGHPRTKRHVSHSSLGGSVPPHGPPSFFSCHKYLKSPATWQWENDVLNYFCVASFHA